MLQTLRCGPRPLSSHEYSPNVLMLQITMKSKVLRMHWLTLVLIQANGVIAQEPPSGQSGKDERKLPEILRAEPVKESPQDDDLRKLLKARYNEACAEMKARFVEFEAGKTTVDAMLGASQRLLEAGLESSG